MHSQVEESKTALRKRIMNLRSTLYGGEKNLLSEELIEQNLTQFLTPRLAPKIQQKEKLKIAGFVPTPNEASALTYLKNLALAGHVVLLPVYAGANLDWRSWDGVADFTVSKAKGFGAEPPGASFGEEALSEVDLCLVPAVAVDTLGNRLGHGKGYYDRALAKLNPLALTLAIVHDEEVLEAGMIPVAPHDIPVHGVVCESFASIFQPEL